MVLAEATLGSGRWQLDGMKDSRRTKMHWELGAEENARLKEQHYKEDKTGLSKN